MMTLTKFIAIVFLLIVAMNVTSLIVSINSNEGTDSNTHHLEHLVFEFREARENAILHTCGEENERHSEAKLGLEALVKSDGKPPKTVEEKEKVAFFIEGFVNSLVPKYDCGQRLKEETSP